MRKNPPKPRSRALYRLLLWAYPREERERFGREMEETFLALMAQDRRRWGRWAVIPTWLTGIWDVFQGASRAWLRVHAHGRRNLPRRNSQRGIWMVSTWMGDLKFGVRALVRRPVFSLTVILTLALGIGANASVFTLVDGLLLTPLPYEEPEELVTLWSANPVLGWSRTDINPANAWDWRERSRSLEDLAVYYQDRLNLTGEGQPELVSAVRATPNLLGLLGRGPVQGRDLVDGDMGEGRDEAVILTHGFWQRRYGGDPSILNSTILLDGKIRTVVGILPQDFTFLDQTLDVLLPLDFHPVSAERGGHYANALGRLADGVSLDEARRELTGIAAQLQTEHPEANKDWTVEVVSSHEDVLGPIARQASMVLLAAVGFILLMVCVNVANLLLARAGDRRREMAVRTALGAGKARVIRQLLTESLILALVGGGLGLALANGGYRAIVAALPSNVPPVFQFGLDASVVAYTAFITLASVLLFGVVPALRSAKVDAGALRDGGRGGRTRGAARFGTVLVVFQTAMAVVLLVGGGLLMKSIAGMRTQDFGFEPQGVLTLRIAPPSADYPGDADLQVFWETLEDRVGQIPGVDAVGTTQSHPLMGSNWGRTIRIAGGEGTDRTTRLTYASGGLFDALGFRVAAGRGITPNDDADSPLVAVVNQTFVSRYLGEDADPLSASILGEDESAPPIPVVGVIEDVVERGVDAKPEPSIYLPAAQEALRTRSMVIRSGLPPAELVPAVQDAVWSVDPNLPLFQVETMEELVDRRVGGFAVIANLMALFALLSLFLGTLGIYGVTAHAANQRRKEIGVRLALGAGEKDVVRMMVGQGGRRALVGLALGLVLALAVSGAVRGLLVGVEPRDPGIFLMVTGILSLVSFLGLWIPARRASGLDPVEALNSE